MFASEPAERHRQIAAIFSARVASVDPDGWDAPSPVAEWTARDVVGHLVEWFPAFLENGSGVVLPRGASVDDDPVDAWRTQTDAIQGLLDDPATRERMLADRHIGDIPLPQAIDQFYTADVFMHTWDLATATGQNAHLDLDFCADLLGGMEPIEPVMRASGQYGARVPVPAGSDAQTRLLGFIGRDPFWSPPA
ncbi:TIGR03086 family metal-binding protein [Herbiconiux sp. CPCC 205763]|uniref:TIGR03086 family metal-binding protein n=1 Tax=Herbiconiux aconitum TaxID=2970913 RepID=A0ABT2GUY5_9MICO|nr:TIGR03086 family metal-binding protein [Herbiconiux aconitum]MCS5719973.1 TIGR03086 family metal-binding protein [Herbiconiux aconitum]